MAGTVALMSLLVEHLWDRLPGSPYFASPAHVGVTGLILCVGALLAFMMVWVEFTVIAQTSALTFMVAGTFKEIVTGEAASVGLLVATALICFTRKQNSLAAVAECISEDDRDQHEPRDMSCKERGISSNVWGTFAHCNMTRHKGNPEPWLNLNSKCSVAPSECTFAPPACTVAPPECALPPSECALAPPECTLASPDCIHAIHACRCEAGHGIHDSVCCWQHCDKRALVLQSWQQCCFWVRSSISSMPLGWQC